MLGEGSELSKEDRVELMLLLTLLVLHTLIVLLKLLVLLLVLVTLIVLHTDVVLLKLLVLEEELLEDVLLRPDVVGIPSAGVIKQAVMESAAPRVLTPSIAPLEQNSPKEEGLL